MNNIHVKDWMTSSVVCIAPDESLPDAHETMTQHNVRRLPVVNQNGKLVGIVSLSDVREAQPSDATTLSIYELHYLLAKLSVDQVMSRNVYTVTPTTSVGDAAKLMLDHKVGGLPVVEDGRLVGIITESDIFRLVVQQFTD
jgi:acetoin utilization protein AcuB